MIEIVDLQKALTSTDMNKSELESFYIFLNDENTFLSNQYIKEIADKRNLTIAYIDDVIELVPNKNDIFGSEQIIDDNYLYVNKIDKFSYTDIAIKNIKNLIIVCDSMNKESEELFSSYIVKMPKLEEWQIKDYVYTIADGVNSRKLDWLISLCNKDIYRLDNEISKLSLFNKKERDTLFELFADDGMFNDLSDLVVFDLTNAIIKKDIKAVGEILEEIKNFDCEPLGVNTILINSFRNIIQIQLSQNPTAEKLNMKSNQFYALKKSCGYYSKEQLIKIYDIVTSAEYQMKNGYISNDKLIEYMIVKIFSV